MYVKVETFFEGYRLSVTETLNVCVKTRLSQTKTFCDRQQLSVTNIDCLGQKQTVCERQTLTLYGRGLVTIYMEEGGWEIVWV